MTLHDFSYCQLNACLFTHVEFVRCAGILTWGIIGLQEVCAMLLCSMKLRWDEKLVCWNPLCDVVHAI